MRRRLLRSTALIALAAVLVFGIPLGIVGSRLVSAQAEQRLEREADVAAAALVGNDPAAVTPQLLSDLAGKDRRLEVRLPDGSVVAGGDRLDSDDGVLRVAAGEDRGDVAVTIAAAAGSVRGQQGGVWLAVVVLSIIAVAVAVALARLQSRSLARPLELLAERADAIAAEPRALVAADAEPSEIARVESALEGARARVDDALRREREFSANTSHQLRTPLTGLRMRLEELLSVSGDAVARAEAQAALAQADRLQATIEALEEHARTRGTTAHGSSEVAAVLATHARDTWDKRFGGSGRTLRIDGLEQGAARFTPELSRQLGDVLLDNALHHGRGDVRLHVSEDESWLRIAVEDEGAVTPEDPFARGVSTGASSGIGLSVARELVRAAGGELRLACNAPTRFEALLPR